MDQKTKKQATIALKRTFSDLLRENQPANFWGQSFSAWLDAATDEQNALPWNEVSAPNAKYVSRKDVSCALDATGVDEIGNDFFYAYPFLSFGVDLSGCSAIFLFAFDLDDDERSLWLDDATLLKAQGINAPFISYRYEINNQSQGIFCIEYFRPRSGGGAPRACTRGIPIKGNLQDPHGPSGAGSLWGSES